MLAAGEHERAREHRRDPLCGVDGLPVAGDVLEQDPELIASEPRDGVAHPDRLLDPRRHRGEQFVSDLMAEAVVDELEVIEIEEQDGGGRLAAPLPAERLVEPVEEQDAIGQTGERVVECPVAHPVLGGLSLERVREHVRQGLEEVDVAARIRAPRTGLHDEHAERAACG